MALFFIAKKTERKVVGHEKRSEAAYYADRQRIESMKKSGAKVTEIAQAVGVHRGHYLQ